MNRSIRILSLTNQTLIADKCVEANSFLARLKGLIGRRNMEPGEGMLFPRCKEIHMWFMSMAIDVVFVKREGAELRVTSVKSRVQPWRFLPLGDRKASDTLELPEGSIERLGLREGDRLCIG